MFCASMPRAEWNCDIGKVAQSRRYSNYGIPCITGSRCPALKETLNGFEGYGLQPVRKTSNLK